MASLLSIILIIPLFILWIWRRKSVSEKVIFEWADKNDYLIKKLIYTPLEKIPTQSLHKQSYSAMRQMLYFVELETKNK
ncbi:MAG: hypothetical protein PF447_13390, partial [Spirochaetaceae bacterium]|nr:hypothetical protein [Spirochaetaceae bacterium]